MQIELSDELVARLKKLAAKEADWENDDFDLHSYCGSNIDDAYERGETQGEIVIAREIVALMPEEGK